MKAAGTPADAGLDVKARRLLALSRLRDDHFRTGVMVDSAMCVMLSLLIAEIAEIPLTPANLTLANNLDREEARRVIDALMRVGLIVITEVAPDRRIIALTSLGSARMRGYIGDHPDI
ncbi:MAG TPA: hypothetical protein VNS79_07580 [Sphingobium sp.]|nr:hypothetical protein [Sphingobium sp.]